MNIYTLSEEDANEIHLYAINYTITAALDAIMHEVDQLPDDAFGEPDTLQKAALRYTVGTVVAVAMHLLIERAGLLEADSLVDNMMRAIVEETAEEFLTMKEELEKETANAN